MENFKQHYGYLIKGILVRNILVVLFFLSMSILSFAVDKEYYEMDGLSGIKVKKGLVEIGFEGDAAEFLYDQGIIKNSFSGKLNDDGTGVLETNYENFRCKKIVYKVDWAIANSSGNNIEISYRCTLDIDDKQI